MKRKILIIGLIVASFLVGGAMGFLVSGSNVSSTSSSISSYLNDLEKPILGGDVIVHIEGPNGRSLDIYRKDFEREYELVLRSTGASDSQLALLMRDKEYKKNFLESIIAEYLVYLKARSENIENTDNGKIVLRLAARQGLQNLLYQKVLLKNLKEPTEADIDKAYRKYRAEFRKRGITANQAVQIIKGELLRQQLLLAQRNFINSLKEEFRIERKGEFAESSSGGGTPSLPTPSLNNTKQLPVSPTTPSK